MEFIIVRFGISYLFYSENDCNAAIEAAKRCATREKFEALLEKLNIDFCYDI